MTAFEKDMVRVLCGGGVPVLAGRRRALAAFKDELERCRNPFRGELLSGEVRRLGIELSTLEEQQKRLEEKQAAASGSGRAMGFQIELAEGVMVGEGSG